MTLKGRRRYLAGAIACFSFLAGGLIWLLQPQAVALKPYALAIKALPDLRNPGASAHRFGGPQARPMVVNFFFSDCVGCVEELPRFEAASKVWAGKIDFVGVDHFEPRAEGLKLLTSTAISFPVAWDQRGELAPLAGVTAFPSTLLVNHDGKVVKRLLGQVSAERLNRELQVLFRTFHVH